MCSTAEFSLLFSFSLFPTVLTRNKTEYRGSVNCLQTMKGYDFAQVKCINRDSQHSRAVALQLCVFHIFHKPACASSTVATVGSLPAWIRGSEQGDSASRLRSPAGTREAGRVR